MVAQHVRVAERQDREIAGERAMSGSSALSFVSQALPRTT